MIPLRLLYTKISRLLKNSEARWIRKCLEHSSIPTDVRKKLEEFTPADVKVNSWNTIRTILTMLIKMSGTFPQKYAQHVVDHDRVMLFVFTYEQFIVEVKEFVTYYQLSFPDDKLPALFKYVSSVATMSEIADIQNFLYWLFLNPQLNRRVKSKRNVTQRHVDAVINTITATASPRPESILPLYDTMLCQFHLTPGEAGRALPSTAGFTGCVIHHDYPGTIWGDPDTNGAYVFNGLQDVENIGDSIPHLEHANVYPVVGVVLNRPLIKEKDAHNRVWNIPIKK